MSAERAELIGEAVDFGQFETVVRPRTYDNATAGSTEINCRTVDCFRRVTLTEEGFVEARVNRDQEGFDNEF